MDVLIMMGKTFSHFFHIFLCTAHNIVKKSLFLPQIYVDKHHSSIEIMCRMHPIHLHSFFSICHNSRCLPLKIQLCQIFKGTPYHHISIQIQDPVCYAFHGRRYKKTIEESCHSI